MKPLHSITFLNHILLIISCFSLPVITSAQSVKGKIIDNETNQPIAFANITFGNHQGTITDINGIFVIEASPLPEQVTISCMGYQPETVITNSITSLNNTIRLTPLNFQLNEIAVKPGENPALTIMRQVVKHADNHNPELYNPFTCIIYHKMTIGFDLPEDISEDELPQLMDLLKMDQKSYIMLFEAVSEKKHLSKGKEKERIITGRVSGLKDPVLASFPAVLQPFAFYSKFVPLLGTEYLNPASQPGLTAYSFNLEDTIISQKGDSIFYISYKPGKNKNFRGLTGTFHVHGPSHAIQAVSAQTAASTNGMNLFIRQNYQPNNQGQWFPNQLESSLEFGNSTTSAKMPYPLIGKGKSYVTAINTNPQLNPKEFKNVHFEDASMDGNAPEIGNYRYEPLSAKDSLTYQLIDSLGRKAHLDALVNLELSLINGYIPWGKFKLDLQKLLNFNDYEGFKTGIGLYTGPKLSRHFSTGGYVVYGFKDKDTKYGASLDITPFSNPENKLHLTWKDDVNPTGSITFLDGIDKRSGELFKQYMTETMDLTREAEAEIQFRWLQYFKSAISFKAGEITPQKPYIFTGTTAIAPSYTFSEGALKIKWAHGEKFSQTPIGRISDGTKWPKLWINAAYGNWETTASKNYQRIEGQYEQEIHYPSAMHTVLRLQGASLYGDYPLTMLYSALGSYKSFSLNVPYTFATMRLNEFAATRFAAVYLQHSIPLLLNQNKNFKPIIVLTTTIGTGKAPTGIKSFEKGYYESGIYFKNLYSNMLFQYGFAVHYRYGPYHLNKEIDNWAFKLGLDFAF